MVAIRKLIILIVWLAWFNVAHAERTNSISNGSIIITNNGSLYIVGTGSLFINGTQAVTSVSGSGGVTNNQMNVVLGGVFSNGTFYGNGTGCAGHIG